MELTKSGLELGQTLVLTKPIGTGTLFAAQMRGAAQGCWMAAATRSMLVSNAAAARVLAAHGAKACTAAGLRRWLGRAARLTPRTNELDHLDNVVNLVISGPWRGHAIVNLTMSVFVLRPGLESCRRTFRNWKAFCKGMQC